MNVRRPNIQYLEGNDVAPTNMAKDRVEEFARRVADHYQFGVGGDLMALVSRLRGRISYQSLDEWVTESGSIFIHGPADFDILVAQYTHPLRDRFTIAHELGHYFLHSDQGDRPIIAYRSGSTRIEWEANWFAASLLMPEQEFRDAFKRSKDVYPISLEFGVSPAAAGVRKDALGIA